MRLTSAFSPLRGAMAALLASCSLLAAGAHADPVIDTATLIAHKPLAVETPQGRRDALAEVGTLPVASSPGHVDASVGYISYSVAGPATRPVIFVFNGGPGASSTYLQMGALGPMRAHLPQDPAAPLPAAAPVEANTRSLLDVADLVFLDPPGTGFARLAPGANLAYYHSVAGDAEAVAQAAEQWLVAHGRAGAPVHILGESYGTIRAAAMAGALAKLAPQTDLRGVLLLGQALNMIETSQRPGNVVTYPLALPTLAAIACHDHKRPAPCTPEGSAREASAYGPAYLDALFRGSALAPAQRAQVAARLAGLTGIPASYYLAHDLRISKEAFRVELLRGEGKVLGRYDARYTAPRPANAGTFVGPDAFSAASNLYDGAMMVQLKALGVADPASYRVLDPVEGEWAYGAGDSPFNDWPFMARLEKVMQAHPHMRLFVGTGLYDLTTTVGAADYLLAQSALPPARVQSERFAAGHVSYSDDASWRRLTDALRAFVTAP